MAADNERTDMAGTDRKGKPPTSDNAKPKPTPPPSPAEDDDDEDGDIATPKRDRYGTDDEPLE